MPLIVKGADVNDEAARSRIMENVPPLLIPAGSITRIDLRLRDGKVEKRGVIKDQQTITFICSGLRHVILQNRFKIGRQWHQPSQMLQIVLVHKEKPPIHLNWVGMSMYWITWNEEMRKSYEAINFQSEEFDRVFFSNAFLDLFQREN